MHTYGGANFVPMAYQRFVDLFLNQIQKKYYLEQIYPIAEDPL